MLRGIFLVAGAVIAGVTSNVALAQEATPRIAQIDWPTDEPIGVAGGLRDRLPTVDETLLPVLIPRSFYGFKSLRFVGQPLEYAASVRADNASISVVGTRIAVDVPGAEDNASDGVLVEMSDKGISASVRRYGAAYVVTVECATLADYRCAKEQYVLDLISGFELVGGGKGAPGTSPSAPASSDLIGVSADPSFRYDPAGQLLPGSGNGVSSAVLYAPNIRFPVATKPAYLNSQVYGYGGYLGPHSNHGWRDPRNYAYPWRDNFCEIRGYTTPACPSGKGHQGVDIRPADSADRKYVAVAVEPGRIVKIGVYSVTLAGKSGNHYNYLHLEMAQLRVRLGQEVTAGQPIGLISNDFGKTATSIHLHFEIKQNLNGRGWRHVPPYSSLVAAYQAM